ncbi:MAG TPA: hypothetical protein VGG47_07155 [Acidocella sp.]
MDALYLLSAGGNVAVDFGADADFGHYGFMPHCDCSFVCLLFKETATVYKLIFDACHGKWPLFKKAAQKFFIALGHGRYPRQRP